MRQLQPVIWAKGTFLTPQHLQQQDLFFESLLSFRVDALSYRPWGFSALQIDQESLAGGSFGIQSASGIFPDGLLFDMPSADALPTPKPLATWFADGRQHVDIHLAIPAYKAGGQNVNGAANGPDCRYSPEAITVRDETSGASERPIQVVNRNFRLLADTEARAGTPSLRIARIQKGPGGILQLDPQFVPPLLDIAANDYLLSILRRLVEILSARSNELAGGRRQRNQSLADFSTSDIANFWLLYTVNTWLPEVRHLFESRRGHPEDAYRVLSALAGALTTFSATIHPRDLPAYNHDELGPCFTQLDERLRILLETVVPVNFVSLPLVLKQPSIYSATVDREDYLANTKLFLAISATIPEAELITRTPQLVKLCSATHLDHLIRNALPGVVLTHVPPPASMPVKVNYQYFRINQTGGAWEAILRARNIAAYVPAELPDPKLEVLIVLPKPK